jgi:peptide/nickel transport system substrate-binding protein
MQETQDTTSLHRRTLLGLAAASFGFTGPAWAAKSYKGTLVVATALELKQFNINYTPDNTAAYLNSNIYSKLVAFDFVANTLYPSLAESWEIAPDLLTYTLHLRRGVTWHDGHPFTAADVAWTIEDIMRMGDKAVTSKFVADIDHLDTPDDFTVVIHLKRPNGILLEGFASYYGFNILPKHLYAGTDVLTNPYNRKPIGTGPFKFVEHEVGSHVVLAPHQGYFAEGPMLERLIFQFIPSLPTAMLALQAGEVGYITASPPFADVPRLKSLPGLKVEATSSPIVMWFGFNMDRKEWQDERMRRAIAHAVDRNEIAARLYSNLVKPADGYFTSTVPWANNADAKQPDYNPAEAERLLDAAGHPRGAGGVRMKIRFVVFPTNIWGSVEQAQMVRQQLSKIGIDVEVVVTDFAMRTEVVRNRRDFDLIHSGGIRGPDPSELFYYVGKGGNYNTMNYDSPRVNELLAEGRGTADRGKRRAAYAELQAVLAQDVPMVNLIEYAYIRTYRAGYTDWFWQPAATGRISESMYNLVRLEG